MYQLQAESVWQGLGIIYYKWEDLVAQPLVPVL